MSISNATDSLTLGDYFDELNANTGLQFSDIEFDSKYYDMDRIRESPLTSNSFPYKALHLNIQSLPKKIEELKILINNLGKAEIRLDFILLCETFLADSSAKLYNLPGYSLIYSNRQHSLRGGVAIYIREGIKYMPF